jgi:hypothetical protein
MSSTVIDRARISRFIDELNQSQQPPLRFFLAVDSLQRRDRKPITREIHFPLSAIDIDRNELYEKVNKVASKLCLAALLADVEMTDGSVLTAAEDGVQRLSAIEGVTPNLFTEEILARLCDGAPNEIVVGLSCEERDALAGWAPSPEIQMNEAGKVDYVHGIKVVAFSKDSIYGISLPEANGERICFAFAKGGLHLSIRWTAEFDKDRINATIEAVRRDGERVLKILTTV